MPTLLFTIAPAAVGQLHDLLTCLAKFDENVSWAATTQNVSVSSGSQLTATDFEASSLKFESIKNRSRRLRA